MDLNLWFVGSVLGVLGWLQWWIVRGERDKERQARRRLAVSPAFRERMQREHDIYLLGLMDGRQSRQPDDVLKGLAS